jgi:hypothetical protein
MFLRLQVEAEVVVVAAPTPVKAAQNVINDTKAFVRMTVIVKEGGNWWMLETRRSSSIF